MMHVILGLFCIALGVWGIFDEWYYVLDYLKASSSVVLLVGGLIALAAGVMGRPASRREEPEPEPEAPEAPEANGEPAPPRPPPSEAARARENLARERVAAERLAPRPNERAT